MKSPKTKKEPEPMLNFSKYDFVKSYIKNAKTDREKLLKEEEACLIADAIKESNRDDIKNLATKDDLKNEIVRLDNKIELMGRNIVIRMTVIMGTLLALFHALEKFTG